jgi:trigger factor
MKVRVEELSPVSRSVAVEVGSERVEPKLEEAYREWGQKATVPGFRRGKIPKSILELHFRREIEEEVLRGLLPLVCEEAIREASLRAVGLPRVEEMALAPDHSLRLRLTVEVKPNLEVKDYFGVEVVRKPVEVTEEEVSSALKVLQDRASQFVPMEGWPALAGDLVYLDYEAWVGKKAVKELRGENYPVILGSRSFLPELQSALHGMMKGEKKEVEATLPSDFSIRELAGKRAVFRLAVREIKKKRVPELNDDFPKEIGEEGTLEDLREKVKKELLREKERERDWELQQEILEKISRATPFEPPLSLVEEELAEMMEQVGRSLASRGASLQDLDVDEEAFRQRMAEEAKERVRRSLILEAIAAQEGVEPTEEEIQQEVDSLAVSLQRDGPSLRRHLEEKGGLEEVRRMLRERKTLQLLFQRANVVTGDRIILA